MYSWKYRFTRESSLIYRVSLWYGNNAKTDDAYDVELGRIRFVGKNKWKRKKESKNNVSYLTR